MEDKTLRGIIRAEREKLSGLTWRQRLGYVWDYYKPLMAAVLVVIFAVYLVVSIYHGMKQKEILNVYLLNCNSLDVDSEEMAAEFAEYLGGTGKNEVITIDAGLELGDSDYAYASQIKLMALMGSQQIDILLLEREQFDSFCEEEILMDLTDVLSQEQLEAWEPYLVYGGDQAGAASPVYGVDMQESPVLQKYHAYNGEVCAAVFHEAVNTDICDDFFEFLLKK